jgi:hypothetical protein
MTRTLYDPSFEHDACGVGMVADLTGRASLALPAPIAIRATVLASFYRCPTDSFATNLSLTFHQLVTTGLPTG